MSEPVTPQKQNVSKAPSGFDGMESSGQESLGSSFKSPPAFSLSASPVQAKVGGGSAAPIQRAVNDPITEPYVVEGQSILTYAQLSWWIFTCKNRLENLQTEITTAALGVPDTIPTAITHAQELIDLFIGGGEEAITEGIREDAQAWATQFSRAMIAGNAAIAAKAQRDLREANERFRAQQRDLTENVIPALRERQRSAFRSDESSALAQTADTIMTAVDCGLTLESVILAIGEERAALENVRNFAAGRSGLYVEANTRLPGIMHVITRVNQAYAAFQLLRTGMQLLSGSTTELGAASNGVSAMATIYSAGGTLLGASAGITLYANLYIGPMVSACLVMIDRIADMRSRTHNRGMIALGHYDSVNWLIEPGGRAMFDYMLRVMHADGESDTPAPTGAAAEYFLSQRSKFNAGVRSGEMPVDGWIWREINSESFKRWVFNRRQDVWGMLYGAMDVPRA
jgi:hypothetical protein